MFAKIENGRLITANTLHTPVGVFDGNSTTAPDGWHIVADIDATPLDTVDANGVPQLVTARQARLALNAAGLLDDIDAALATMPRDAQIEWQYAHEIRRDSPLIAAVASGFGLENAAIDELFTQASKL
jgi:hypothetical protein